MDLGKLLLVGTAATVVVTGGVLFVVLTGGLGGGGGDDAPGSVAEITAEDLPPGVTKGSGVTDPKALAEAHNGSLRGRSYEMTLTVDATTSAEGRSREVRQVQTARVGGDGTFVTSFSQKGRVSFSRTVWGNDSVALERIAQGDQERFDTTDLTRVRRNVSGHVVLGEVLAVGNFTVENVSQRDGETVFTLRADGPAEDGAEEMDSVESVSSFSGTVLVGGDGVVHELIVEMNFTDRRGRRTTAVFEFSVESIGSTGVERPDWVSRALARTDAALRPAVRGAPAPA